MSDGMKRRDFLKVVGVGAGTAATAGCATGDVERLIPYVVPAEEIVPGVPTWYASTCRECPAGCGIHVETHSGRATKVEGNPDHPINRGNLCARGQASVQGLYHPDRYKGPFRREPAAGDINLAWSTAERQLAERIRELRDGGLASRIVFLTGDYTGTKERLVSDWVSAIGARRVVYDVWQDQPRDLNFADADFLISFGADFLETWGSPVDYSWQFAQMHSYRNGRRGKFVWVGPHRPLTGLNADQWVAPRPGTEAIVAQAMAGAVDMAAAAQQTGVPQEVLAQLAQEFRAGRGVALGPGPAVAGRNQSELQAAVNRLNGGGSTATAGRTRMQDVALLVEQMRRGEVELLLIDAPNPAYTLPGALNFAEAMARVPMRVSFSTFPDQTSLLSTLVLPDHHFLEAWDDYIPYAGVRELVQPSMRPVFNTKQTGDVLLSVARLLGNENVSPGIAATTYYDYLRANWGAAAGGDAWRTALKQGGIFPAAQLDRPAGALAEGDTDTAREAEAGFGPNPVLPQQAAVAPAPIPNVAPAPSPSFAPVEFEAADGANFHLVIYPSYRFYDGRTANRPWLLELPDPVTKVSWQSWVEMHPRAAEELGIHQGDTVEVTSPYGAVAAPVYVYPGVRPDTIAIQTGLGHDAFGRYTENRGINPNVLLGVATDATSGAFAPYGLRVAVQRTAGHNRYLGSALGVPQGLFEGGVRIQHDREIARAISVAELAAAEHQTTDVPGEHEIVTTLRGYGGFAPAPAETNPSAYPPPGTHYGQYIEGATRWAMAIDLSRCIGCSACVTACYAENNIPVVGPDEVRKGRELTWLRIERYFGVSRHEEEAYADDATDDVRFLPMLCQHCGNAPCEPVCPVYAAYHTPDGLNGQVYNRCVGTRYCANNCPYKVRYFNWFSYEFETPLNWQLNPDVTVRDKGVMEKCTFCVQRIRAGERDAAVENRTVRDGEIVPACVQTCPTEVFVFGNIADPNSAVAQAAASTRSYRVLEELNTQPAIVYLKKVTLKEPARGGHHAAPATAGAH
jgi:anaerobic selenocysteine-containing dehydrogenase/Fe-S-cluster-containing dehydrogenase component